MAKTHSFVVTGPYYTAFGPLRLDLATPLHKRCADSLIRSISASGRPSEFYGLTLRDRPVCKHDSLQV